MYDKMLFSHSEDMGYPVIGQYPSESCDVFKLLKVY